MTIRAPVSERTVLHLLSQHVEERPGSLFLAGDGFAFTYEQTWDRSARLANGLAQFGVAREERVALWLDNCPEFLFAWFATVMCGAVQVPQNPDVAGARLVHVLNHSGCTTLVLRDRQVKCLNEHLGQLSSVRRLVILGENVPCGDLETVTFDDLAETAALGRWEISASDTAAIMFTSGSTGPAKGVVIPHGQHVTNGEQALDAIRLRPDDVLLLVLPLHHNMAQGYGVMAALAAGCSVWLEPGFERARFWEVAERSGATVFPFVGALLVLLDKQDVHPGAHRVRAAYGVPIVADLHARFEQRFGVRLVHGYGSTEATIVAWGSLEGERVLGSAGKVLDDFEVEIHDAFDQRLPVGEIGEICIRPRKPYTMFQGYYAEPERGRIALRNLWFHSGDRGRIDELGNLWFEGRNEDALRRFGEFISATEVEQAFQEHPDIELVAAVGIDDEVAGQEVMVVVVLRAGCSPTVEEMRGWAEARLPAFAVPRYVELAPSLPTTPTGKIEKHKIRSRGVTAATWDFREPM